LASVESRWPAQRANEWYSSRPWIIGCNFIPSTAVNQLEMWQAETFDPVTIDRELSWAAGTGMNSVRVFLHDLLWEADGAGFAQRIDRFLQVAWGHGISTLFVLFDDCWYPGARLGPQERPLPGKHNSRWLQSPGHDVVGDPSARPRLEAYVKGVVGAFKSDERVLGWDIYNEVTNVFLPLQDVPAAERREALSTAVKRRQEAMPHHLDLLGRAFEWARETRPEQPLTAGMFMPDRELNARLAALSDVISFHTYDDAERSAQLIQGLRRHGRPLLCTEYLSRGRGCTFHTHLPLFSKENVGCFNWGLVNGRTQTHIAWTGETEPWFHDIFHPDGTPYDSAETDLIRGLALSAG
jgi:hypothetical protein